MSFMQLFKQSNLSLDKITGNVIKSPVEQLRGNKVLLNTGLKDVTTCFLTECFFVQKELRQKKNSVSKRVRDMALPPSAKCSIFLNLHKNNLVSKAISSSVSVSASASASASLLPTRPSAFLADATATATSDECFKAGRSAVNKSVQLLQTKQTRYCIVRVDNVASNSVSGVTMGSSSGQLFGEPQIILPKRLHKMRRRFLIWSELSKMWKNKAKLTTNNVVRFLDVGSNKSTLRPQSTTPNVTIRGFLLNSVKGGYAVGIAGNIAFLPKSLRRGRKIYRGQWRMFSILNMNPKLRNIVVKQHVHGKGAFTPSGAFSFNRRASRIAQPVFHKTKHARLVVPQSSERS